MPNSMNIETKYDLSERVKKLLQIQSYYIFVNKNSLMFFCRLRLLFKFCAPSCNPFADEQT